MADEGSALFVLNGEMQLTHVTLTGTLGHAIQYAYFDPGWFGDDSRALVHPGWKQRW